MIGKLTGRLDSVGENWAIIDVGGVGYAIFASSRTLSQLGVVGSSVTVKIETHVREDHIHLFGFATEEERSWFQLLQIVQGVGAKAALAILSALSTDEIAKAIASQDKTVLCRADGVGQKLATRIINELKEKAANAFSLEPTFNNEAASSQVSFFEDAISAMTNLGFSRNEAHQVVSDVLKDFPDDGTLDQLISSALRELAS
ncbi:MAG: Holliday junction branch migration protein RuvA [Rhodospirillaceae bacterium]|nr:Holliday junction branch migration protein RuvA [Rhodospirillaceae bacterium]|tara:strand:- start:34 stop:639 length:606 start_codon:yes stop_codon:yes gene_type:complete